MYQDEYEAAVAAFIRNNGITRCPTACAWSTQGTVPAADRAALRRYAARSGGGQHKTGLRDRVLWDAKFTETPGD